MDMHQLILKKLIKDKDYKNFNKIANLLDSKVSKKFKSDYYFDYISLGKIFEDVKYFPDKELFFVKISGKWQIINEKGRVVNSMKHQNIKNIDGEYYTAIDNNENRVISLSGDIISKLSGDKYMPFSGEYLIIKNNNKFQYVNTAGETRSKEYEDATNFIDNKAIVLDNEAIIIDNNFNILKTLGKYQIKKDFSNRSIFNNVVILRNKKYIAYNLQKDKWSDYYDDIDFNYGDLIAVKSKDKWGYIDQDFNKVIDFNYDFAKSFTSGIGIVKKGEIKYLLSRDNMIKMKDNILSFNKNGIGFRKVKEGYELIKLTRCIND